MPFWKLAMSSVKCKPYIRNNLKLPSFHLDCNYTKLQFFLALSSSSVDGRATYIRSTRNKNSYKKLCPHLVSSKSARLRNRCNILPNKINKIGKWKKAAVDQGGWADRWLYVGIRRDLQLFFSILVRGLTFNSTIHYSSLNLVFMAILTLIYISIGFCIFIFFLFWESVMKSNPIWKPLK